GFETEALRKWEGESERVNTPNLRSTGAAAVDDQEAPLVVAGFEPFNGRRRNRSWEVVRQLGVRKGVQTLQLPVDFARLKAVVPQLMSGRPRGLLLLGESPAERVCVEQIALNVLDSDGADNSGAKPQMETIVAGGPLALLVSWNARAVEHKLNQSGIPSVASFPAGPYACHAAF